MMSRKRRHSGIEKWWPLTLVVTVAGCAQVLDIDKPYHLGGSGGATGGTTTTGGAGGGTGGTGGGTCSNGAKSCGQPTDCDPPGNECVMSTCDGGCCGVQNATVGTECTSGGGVVCDGKGACLKCAGNGDCKDPLRPICCKETCVAAVVQVAAGGSHTCVVKSDRTLWCWGYNYYGQLGDGTVGGPDCGGHCKSSPVQVSALGSEVAEVSTGAAHTCARKTDGTLWCWGTNEYGQLGNGIIGGPDCTGACVASPVQVGTFGTSAAKISASTNHTCAVKKDDTLWCWGLNAQGQLGDGTLTGPDCGGACKASPAKVVALGATVMDFALSGNDYTCALKVDGSLWCWGANAKGQLGDGTVGGPECSGGCRSTPAQVAALENSVDKIAAGSAHTCAAKVDGSLWCWGNNGYGQLGDGTSTGPDCGGACTASPKQVIALGNSAVDVTASESTTCVRRADDSLWCWGDNELGVLGNGTIGGSACGGNCDPSPAQVAMLGVSVVSVSMGAGHTCVLKNDSTLWCWGNNAQGQLGDGTTSGPACMNTCQPSPTQALIGVCQ